jgi:hypothetical protein
MQGEPALLVLPSAEAPARVILLLGLEKSEHGVLTAELSPDYLWQFIPQNASVQNPRTMHVIDSDGQVLYTTSMQDSKGLTSALLKRSHIMSGLVSWSDARGKFRASYLTLNLHQHYASNDWEVAVASPWLQQ